MRFSDPIQWAEDDSLQISIGKIEMMTFGNDGRV
jgi:hypothetical protein